MNNHDIRLELYRERTTGRYRWRTCVPGHIIGDSGQSYSRRIDCLVAGCRNVGIREDEITWLGSESPTIYDYGQATRNIGLVEVFVWKRWWRR